MSIQEINAKDRVASQVLANGAVRYGVYDSGGNLLRYEYIKREDEPTEAGTNVNKVLFDLIDSNTMQEMANRKRVDRYNIPTYTTNTVTHTDDIIPKSDWVQDTAYTKYHNGSISITANSGSSATRAYYACDGNNSTRTTISSSNPFIIDLGAQYNITKLKTYVSNAFKVEGSNDGTTYTELHSNSSQSALTEITLTTHGYYRYYRITTTSTAVTYVYEVQVSEYLEVTNMLLIEDGASTEYEAQEIILIQAPNDLTSGVPAKLSKNNLEYKNIVNGDTLTADGRYTLVYSNGQYEIVQ